MRIDCPKCGKPVEWESTGKYKDDGVDFPEDDNPQTVNLLFECGSCGFKFAALFDLHSIVDQEEFEPVVYRESNWVNEFDRIKAAEKVLEEEKAEEKDAPLVDDEDFVVLDNGP